MRIYTDEHGVLVIDGEGTSTILLKPGTTVTVDDNVKNVTITRFNIDWTESAGMDEALEKLRN